MLGNVTIKIFNATRDEPPVERLALLLSGAWRGRPPGLCVSSSELEPIISLALRSRTGALAWWRVHSQVPRSSVILQLEQAYRVFTIYSALHEDDVKVVFRLFRSNGIEPILIKGWAVARLYPALGLRPYGDIDLCIPPVDNAAAMRLLEAPEANRCSVDLVHEEITDLACQRFEELYARSCLVDLDDVRVRIPSPEDHLRILCLHFLKHGARIPLGLCDVAVALESRPQNFNWDLCLGGSRKQAHWTACTLALARHLLGANLDNTPLARGTNMPSWLPSYVLRQWQDPYAKDLPTKFTSDLAKYSRNPSLLWCDLRDRWPNRIEATMAMRAPFNRLPRFILQLCNCFVRAKKVLGEAIGNPA